MLLLINVRDRSEFYEDKIMVIETERLLLRKMTEKDFHALYKVWADSDMMQHYPYVFDENRVRNWILRNIERYRVFGFGLFNNTPFNVVYSYMNDINEPSYKTAIM